MQQKKGEVRDSTKLIDRIEIQLAINNKKKNSLRK